VTQIGYQAKRVRDCRELGAEVLVLVLVLVLAAIMVVVGGRSMRWTSSAFIILIAIEEAVLVCVGVTVVRIWNAVCALLQHLARLPRCEAELDDQAPLFLALLTRVADGLRFPVHRREFTLLGCCGPAPLVGGVVGATLIVVVPRLWDVQPTAGGCTERVFALCCWRVAGGCWAGMTGGAGGRGRRFVLRLDGQRARPAMV